MARHDGRHQRRRPPAKHGAGTHLAARHGIAAPEQQIQRRHQCQARGSDVKRQKHWIV
ncbi:MAG: hypothetical protein IJT98_07755 [Prevotella sp.]|nr:hypothetical protein [Prevotella sp.]